MTILSVVDCQAVEVLMVRKGGHQYLMRFKRSNRVEALRAAGRWAVNPDLNFTWADAAIVAGRLCLAGAAAGG